MGIAQPFVEAAATVAVIDFNNEHGRSTAQSLGRDGRPLATRGEVGSEDDARSAIYRVVAECGALEVQGDNAEINMPSPLVRRLRGSPRP